MANQDSKSMITGLGLKNSAASTTRIIFPNGVAKNVLTQISVNTREHSSVQVANGPKGSEAVQTGQTGFLGFARIGRLERGIYHTYMVKDGEVYKQTSKG